MVAVVAGLFAETPSTTLAATPTARPNVLLIVTDDQTLGTITPQVMPITRQRMIVEGRTYPNFTIADPVCCPSRATIMSGRYSHNTGVHDNHRRSLAAFDERGTVQCYLHRAGYQTGFFGKIFNSWPMYAVHPAPNRYREPLCMDHYAVNAGGGHSGIRILADGRLSIPPGYTDDVVLSKALAYLSSTERDDAKPWYMYVAPTYPHSPAEPRPEHASDVLPIPPISPAVGEDVSDKPKFIRLHQDSYDTAAALLGQERMLETVDSEVGSLFSQMAAQGELDNTLVIFVSDNGRLLGEHGIAGKSIPYTESIAVPFAMRWPGHIGASSTGTRLASNVDILPTILDATNVHPTLRHPLDGHSLIRPGWSRAAWLNESWTRCATIRGTPCTRAGWVPNWSSYRTASFQYIEWRRYGRLIAREYYDLAADPYELTNLLGDGDPSDDPPTAALSRRLHDFRACSGTTCP